MNQPIISKISTSSLHRHGCFSKHKNHPNLLLSQFCRSALHSQDVQVAGINQAPINHVEALGGTDGIWRQQKPFFRKSFDNQTLATCRNSRASEFAPDDYEL